MSDPGYQSSEQDEPSTPSQRRALVVETVERQLRHYGDKAGLNRGVYFAVKVVQIVLAAAVPVAASANAPVPVTGSLGALIVILEGVQQLCQWHANWIRYRTTAESLRRELFLFRAIAGDYALAVDPVQLLARRMHEAVSTEVTGWSKTFSGDEKDSRKR